MLRCIFGKCSSEKYIVNKPTKQNGIVQPKEGSGRITQSLTNNDQQTQQQNNNKIPQPLINNENQTSATQDNKQQIDNRSTQPLNNNEEQASAAQNNKNQINNTIQITDSKITQNGQIPTATDKGNQVESSRETNNDQIQKADNSPTPYRSNEHEENEIQVIKPQITKDSPKPNHKLLANVEIKEADTSQTTENSSTNEAKHVENSEIKKLDNVTTNNESSVKSKAPQPPQRKIEEDDVQPEPEPISVAAEDSAAETYSDQQKEAIEESVPIADIQSKPKPPPISVTVEDSATETLSYDEKQKEIIEESIPNADVQSKPKPPPITLVVEKSVVESSSHNENQKEKIEESVSITTTTKSEPESIPVAVEDSAAETSSHEVNHKENVEESVTTSEKPSSDRSKEEEDSGVATLRKRRSGVIPVPVNYDEDVQSKLKTHPKSREDAALIKEAIQRNDFLNKIINGKRLDDVVNAMYSKEIPTKTTIVKQGDKGTHMYISASGRYQVLIKNKAVSEFSDVRVFGELAILYNAKRLATIKALSLCRVWVLDYHVFQQIMVRHNIKRQDEIMEFLMNSEKLKVVGREALMEVANLLKSEFFKPGTQIVRQGDKGNTFYIIRAGTVTITKDGEGVVGLYKKGDCFGELALLKEDCRQATVTADPPGVECLTLTRKEFVDHLGELRDWEYISIRPQDSFKDGVTEHEDIDLRDLKMIKTLGVGGFGRVELVQHKKKNDQVFALKYLKKIDIVMQHQQEHVYNEKNIQMACKSPFIVRLYRTYKDNKYIYLLMESCLGGDLWSLLQKQKLRRFEEKEARFIAGCVLEAFDYLHSRGIIYRDLKPENLLIAVNGYIKLTDFGFAKKISSRGKTFTFAGTPEYVAPEIVLNRGHDRSVDYWAFGAFIFELLTGRTPFRTDDSSHMKTYNKILSGIDNVTFPSYVNMKARHIVEKLCRPVPSERLGMQRGGIKDIKTHKWFLGFDWGRFAKCDMQSPFRPRLKSQIDTQYFDQFKKDTDVPPDEISGWDSHF